MKSKLIKFRALEIGDLDRMYEWENDSSIWKEGSNISPLSREDLRKYIESVRDIYTDKQLRLIICKISTDEAVGMIDLFDFEPLHLRASVGLMIDPTQRRNGFATDALSLIEQYAFNHLGLHQLSCSVRSGNTPSQELFRQMGYREIGLFKEWLRLGHSWQDLIIYQKFLAS